MTKAWYEKFEAASKAKDRVLLYGPPGTGKTTVAMETRPDAYPVTLHPEMSAQELVGHFVPKGDEFVWHDGPALRALREGKPLVLNEVDKASGSVMTALYSLLDDHSVMKMTLPTGEVVEPTDGYQVFCTMNGYLDALPDAIRDRLSVRINADYPHPNALNELRNDAVREAVENSYESRRQGAEPEAGFVSLREAMAFEDLKSEPLLDPADAAESVWGERGDEVLFAMDLGSSR